MATSQLYVANWKMYWTCKETLQFAAQHYDNFCTLAQDRKHTASIVLCPSFTALQPLATMFEDTPIAIGAQDCSANNNGAYTGQISAKDLHFIGCTYGIVGHSEQRRLYNHNDALIADKCGRLLDNDINPIFCIGETIEEHNQDNTLTVLEKQLTPLMALLKKRETLTEGTQLIVAYEPVWAIGSGITPSLDQLETVFAWLSKTTQKNNPLMPWRFIYGGSVNHSNASPIIKINNISGFLIGSASLDYQEFEKIVKCN